MSKTKKLLLLLFTIFWCVPFTLTISRIYSGGLIVTLSVLSTKSPYSNSLSQRPNTYTFSKSNCRQQNRWPMRPHYVIAVFHSPGCYLSKKLAPEYAAPATTMLKGEASKAVLEKVDSTEEKELARKDAVGKMIPRVYNVRTTEEAEHILAAGSTIVLGFLDTLKGPDNAELAAASILQTDVNFYQTDSARVAKIFQIDPKIKRPALVILKNRAEVYSQFEGQFTRLAIADFVSMNKPPLVITFNIENSPLVFSNHLKQLWLFASANDSEIMSTFQDAAKAFKGRLLFVYVEIVYDVKTPIHFQFGANEGTQMSFFTLSHPQIVAYTRYALRAKKNVLDGELTMRKIKLFGENFLEDKLPSDPMAEKVLNFH